MTTTDTPKRLSDDDLISLHYASMAALRDILAHDMLPLRIEAAIKAAVELEVATVERLSAPPSQGKVEKARELLAQVIEAGSPRADMMAALIRDLKEIPGAAQVTVREAIAAITQAITESSGKGTDGACCEAMREAILSIIPGGDICDPQQIADAIRALPLPVSADGRGAVIEPTDEMVMAAADFCSRCDSDECGWLGCSRNQLRAALNLKSNQPSDTGGEK